MLYKMTPSQRVCKVPVPAHVVTRTVMQHVLLNTLCSVATTLTDEYLSLCRNSSYVVKVTRHQLAARRQNQYKQ